MKAIHISNQRVDRSPRRVDFTRISVEVTYPERWSSPGRIGYEVPVELAPEVSQGGNPWLVSILPLAMTLRCPLSTDLPVDTQLLANASQLLCVWSDWHPGLEPITIQAPVSETLSGPAYGAWVGG